MKDEFVSQVSTLANISCDEVIQAEIFLTFKKS